MDGKGIGEQAPQRARRVRRDFLRFWGSGKCSHQRSQSSKALGSNLGGFGKLGHESSSCSTGSVEGRFTGYPALGLPAEREAASLSSSDRRQAGRATSILFSGSKAVQDSGFLVHGCEPPLQTLNRERRTLIRPSFDRSEPGRYNSWGWRGADHAACAAGFEGSVIVDEIE
jgi:hypothetical protein